MSFTRELSPLSAKLIEIGLGLLVTVSLGLASWNLRMTAEHSALISQLQAQMASIDRHGPEALGTHLRDSEMRWRTLDVRLSTIERLQAETAADVRWLRRVKGGTE